MTVGESIIRCITQFKKPNDSKTFNNLLTDFNLRLKIYSLDETRCATEDTVFDDDVLKAIWKTPLIKSLTDRLYYYLWHEMLIVMDELEVDKATDAFKRLEKFKNDKVFRYGKEKKLVQELDEFSLKVVARHIVVSYFKKHASDKKPILKVLPAEEAEQEILALLRADPFKSWHYSTIATVLSIHPSTVGRAISNLKRQKIKLLGTETSEQNKELVYYAPFWYQVLIGKLTKEEASKRIILKYLDFADLPPTKKDLHELCQKHLNGVARQTVYDAITYLVDNHEIIEVQKNRIFLYLSVKNAAAFSSVS